MGLRTDHEPAQSLASVAILAINSRLILSPYTPKRSQRSVGVSESEISIVTCRRVRDEIDGF
jgi:hypothetical protein